MTDTTPPLCKCHGEPKQWVKDANRKAGGYWRCKVKQREAKARYKLTEKGRAANARYAASEKGRHMRAGVDERVAASRIQVTVGGVTMNYRVPPERKDELRAKLAEHRAGQWAEYREEFA